MNTRAFHDVINELETEGHVALADLVRLVAHDETLGTLQPDCSHLRLLLRHPASSSHLLIGYGSAEQRGRRTPSDPDAEFEIVVFRESGGECSEKVIGLEPTLIRLRLLAADLSKA